ncbi:sister chromatid cohesion protein PDS5 homolog C-like isoform X1 [Curcuma longa]|uniref:sister chromatid cohesion protein PDS5 homolog C-like isoform X1 n=1 Tax=Curcuma longa TaxID=136217 RepID=UPI003D9F54F0
MDTEKELVDDLRDVGKQLESPPTDVDDLLTLLDQTEQLLMRVRQSPSQSIIDALHPAMNLLVDKRLLRHPNEDVKAIVASCTNEIMRITAPDAPYNDDLMKEVFENIVDTLDKLDDISNDSFFKRVSIVDTFAKVRSFVVMLDLECDALVLNMFRIFLRTIRPNHNESIFSSMETIMTVLLEESDNISEGLLFCLLDAVKIDNKNTLPIAHKLAERVIAACASKLKPYLGKFVKPRVVLRDYSKVVASIIEGNSGFGGQKVINSANVKELANTKREDTDGETLNITSPSLNPSESSDKSRLKVGCSYGSNNSGTKPKMLAAAKRKIVGEVSSAKQNSEKGVAGEMRKKIRKLDERLVGKRVQVWWPDDQLFYTGTIMEYDHATKKHKVLYDDGDVEILLLKEERWMFASEIRTSPTHDFAEDAKDAIDASLDDKAANTKSNSTAGETNVQTVIKSAAASSELPKRKGRPPKVGRSGQSKPMEDVSPKVDQKLLFKDMHEPRSKVTGNDKDILRSKQDESSKPDQKPEDIPSLNASGGEPKTSLNPQRENS